MKNRLDMNKWKIDDEIRRDKMRDYEIRRDSGC
jgi:hypothetical protein